MAEYYLPIVPRRIEDFSLVILKSWINPGMMRLEKYFHLTYGTQLFLQSAHMAEYIL